MGESPQTGSIVINEANKRGRDPRPFTFVTRLMPSAEEDRLSRPSCVTFILLFLEMGNKPAQHL
jgi:hypothetical protein